MEKILIVDDIPANIKILGSLLNKDYNILIAGNGEDAINIANEKEPDLIILDIMMPDMDGYTVCRYLKGNQKTKEIPVIFITAKNEIGDIVHGFEAGGVDYIIKPFQPEEVIMRIKTHITIQRQKKQLEGQKKQLEEVNATKDKFFSIIAHDLRNPVSSFKMVFSEYDEIYELLTEKERKDLINSLKISAENLYMLLEQLLTWARSQQGRIKFNPRLVNLKEIVENVISTQKVSADNKNIGLISDILDDITLIADSDMLITIIRNLISNSIKFTREKGEVRISCEEKSLKNELKGVKSTFYEIAVSDNGVGMCDETKNKLFRIESTHKDIGTRGESGTGLGLLLCKEFIGNHRGDIWAESELGKGSCLKFTIMKDPII